MFKFLNICQIYVVISYLKSKSVRIGLDQMICVEFQPIIKDNFRHPLFCLFVQKF